MAGTPQYDAGQVAKLKLAGSAKSILQTYQGPDEVKGDAFDAVAHSVTPEDLSARLQSLDLPDYVKSALLEAQAGKGPRGEWFTAPKGPQGSAIGRFVSGVGEMVNPVSLAKGVYQAITSPLQTLGQIDQSLHQQWDKAGQDWKQGHYSEAAGHAVAGILPIVGPAAAESGEQIASGDIAGGVGKGVGLLAPAAVSEIPKLVRGAAPAAATAGVASKLDEAAQAAVASTMKPRVGGQLKWRMANQAEDLAPEILKRGLADAWTRTGLHDAIKGGLDQASQALDDAADARNAGRPIETAPILADLQAARAKLTAKAFDADKITPTTVVSRTPDGYVSQTKAGVPVGRDVVPGPNANRVAMIDKAITEVSALGSQASYESLRAIRQAYDGPAKAVYSPSMTADYLTAQGGKLGAADVTGAIRDHLATADPATAAANAEYHFYRSVDDILEVTKETEGARPKVARRIAIALGGALAGGQAGGLGAVIGATVATAGDVAAAGGATWKLKFAQTTANLADALRTGSTGQAVSAFQQLKAMGRRAAVLQGRSTSPSETQTGGAPALAPIR